MTTAQDARRASFLAFLLGAMALIVAAGAIWSLADRGGEGPPPPPAETPLAGDFAAGELEPTDVVDRSGLPDCRRRMMTTEIRPTGKLAEELEAGRLSFRAISPATPSSSGGTQLFVKTTFRFSCDGSTGVIGYRGGFRLTRGETFVDFRRLRIDADRNLIRMFGDSVTQEGYNGLTCDLDLARTEERDGRVITTIPLLLTGEGRVAMNVGLGLSSRFDEGDVVGDIVMEMETIAG